MTITLAFLTPKLVQAAVEGRLPCGISITRLRDAPAEWFARDHIDKPSIAYWRETRSRRRPSGARRSRRACNRDLRCPAPPRAALAAGARREHRSQLRNHAEIDRSDGVRMVAQECPPGLRWRPSAPDHVFGNRRLGDLKPELKQFTMDAWGAPQWVLPRRGTGSATGTPLLPTMRSISRSTYSASLRAPNLVK
jgi:hypothetical protein